MKKFFTLCRPICLCGDVSASKVHRLETARIILGHRSAAITEVYAELDQKKATEAIVKVG